MTLWCASFGRHFYIVLVFFGYCYRSMSLTLLFNPTTSVSATSWFGCAHESRTYRVRTSQWTPNALQTNSPAKHISRTSRTKWDDENSKKRQKKRRDDASDQWDDAWSRIRTTNCMLLQRSAVSRRPKKIKWKQQPSWTPTGDWWEIEPCSLKWRLQTGEIERNIFAYLFYLRLTQTCANSYVAAFGIRHSIVCVLCSVRSTFVVNVLKPTDTIRVCSRITYSPIPMSTFIVQVSCFIHNSYPLSFRTEFYFVFFVQAYARSNCKFGVESSLWRRVKKKLRSAEIVYSSRNANRLGVYTFWLSFAVQFDRSAPCLHRNNYYMSTSIFRFCGTTWKITKAASIVRFLFPSAEWPYSQHVSAVKNVCRLEANEKKFFVRP